MKDKTQKCSYLNVNCEENEQIHKNEKEGDISKNLCIKKKKKKRDFQEIDQGEMIMKHEGDIVKEPHELLTKKKKKKKERLDSEKPAMEELNSSLDEREVPLKKPKCKMVSEEPVNNEDDNMKTAQELSVRKKKKKRDITESELLTPIIKNQNLISEITEQEISSDMLSSKKKKKRESEKANSACNEEIGIIEDKFPLKKKNKAKVDYEEHVAETEHSFGADVICSVKKKKNKSEKKEHKALMQTFDQQPVSENEEIQKSKESAHPQYFKQMESKDNVKFGKNLITSEDLNSVYFDAVDDSKELIPIRTEGRHYTVSIAIPASILHETCQKQDLRTYIIGQLARAACIYSVDEIIVYDDNCWKNNSSSYAEEYIGMMSMILQYQECPQYLRKNFFPVHHYLSNNGVLNALNATHHLLAHQWCPYREGVTVSKKCTNKQSSYAYTGLEDLVELDHKLEPGMRVTVHFPPELTVMRKKIGCVVSPDEPRTKAGLYWGYTVRIANSLTEVFKSDRFKEGYDLIIGTSDKGTDATDATFKSFAHALIVFGGVKGLEVAMEADETVTGSDPTTLFPFYLNVCPNQSSRTIRTEEAVTITLSVLSPKLAAKGNTKPR